MAKLSPLLAANMADQVYTVKNETNLIPLAQRFSEELDIQDSGRVSGKSGVSVVSKKTGFGLVAKGKGDFRDDLFILTRGTDSFYDVITDLNAGLRFNHDNQLVHSGFYKCFLSMREELASKLSGTQRYRNVHCVGHSLGGALATLVASWVSTKNVTSNINLYTFGSPRVGYESFSSKFTQTIKRPNIYRVSHNTDVVAMVPSWPFSHVPNPGIGYCIESENGFVSKKSSHRMPQYLSSVKGSNWESLRGKRPEPADNVIEKWLSSKTVVGFASNSVQMIASAIAFVLKKAMHLAGIVIQTGASTAFTILDQLSLALNRAARISKEVASYVKALLGKILKTMGIAVSNTMTVTAQLIKYVFVRLQRTIWDMVRSALNLVHRNN